MKTVLLPFFLLPCLAQAQMSMPMDHSVDSRPVPLVAGLGNSRHTIQTTNPESQKFFNQGMDYLFAFNHDEARRSFQKAAELDPKAAMPLWGVALAVGPNYNDIDIGHTREQQAFNAITKAKQLAANGPAIEADYVEALATRYAQETNHDLKVQGERYAKAMAALVQKHPDDLDAATLYAESLMDLHPWQLALPSAKRLENLTPAAGHLVHMPAHIYQRVGDFNGSAIANQRAILADENYIQSQHLTGVVNMYDTMYMVHNIHFLASSCMMEGNATCATQAAKRLVDHVTPGVPQFRPSEWYLPTQISGMVRFAQWNQIFAQPMPPRDMPYLTAMYRYARGAAFTATKKSAEAAIERKALADAIQSLPADAIPDFNNSAKSVFELALTALDARMAEANGDRAQSIALWQKTVAALDTFSYNEPADWYYPTRESLGGVLLRNHQPAEAEAVFRRDLEQNPNNGRSLFGLWQSLLQQNKAADATLVKRQFDLAWQHADTQISVDSL